MISGDSVYFVKFNYMRMRRNQLVSKMRPGSTHGEDHERELLSTSIIIYNIRSEMIYFTQ